MDHFSHRLVAELKGCFKGPKIYEKVACVSPFVLKKEAIQVKRLTLKTDYRGVAEGLGSCVPLSAKAIRPFSVYTYIHISLQLNIHATLIFKHYMN